jgi:hypothetical protein
VGCMLCRPGPLPLTPASKLISKRLTLLQDRGLIAVHGTCCFVLPGRRAASRPCRAGAAEWQLPGQWAHHPQSIPRPAADADVRRWYKWMLLQREAVPTFSVFGMVKGVENTVARILAKNAGLQPFQPSNCNTAKCNCACSSYARVRVNKSANVIDRTAVFRSHEPEATCT